MKRILVYGVTWNRVKEKWQSQIPFKRQNISLGSYDTKEEAAYIVDQVRLQLLPDTTRFNVFDKECVTL